MAEAEAVAVTEVKAAAVPPPRGGRGRGGGGGRAQGARGRGGVAEPDFGTFHPENNSGTIVRRQRTLKDLKGVPFKPPRKITASPIAVLVANPSPNLNPNPP